MKNKKMIGGATPSIKINKVFGIGLNKTGTHSLNSALNILGFKSIHNCNSEKSFFEDVKSGNFKLRLMKEYDALSHVESAMFFEQYYEAFPDSKFILTLREDKYGNIDEWLSSNERFERAFWKDKTKMKPNSGFYYKNTNLYGVHTFHENRYHYIYNRHKREVEYFFSSKAGKLLVVNIQTQDNEEISKSICKFLGVPINNKAFKKVFENKKVPIGK